MTLFALLQTKVDQVPRVVQNTLARSRRDAGGGNATAPANATADTTPSMAHSTYTTTTSSSSSSVTAAPTAASANNSTSNGSSSSSTAPPSDPVFPSNMRGQLLGMKIVDSKGLGIDPLLIHSHVDLDGSPRSANSPSGPHWFWVDSNGNILGFTVGPAASTTTVASTTGTFTPPSIPVNPNIGTSSTPPTGTPGPSFANASTSPMITNATAGASLASTPTSAVSTTPDDASTTSGDNNSNNNNDDDDGGGGGSERSTTAGPPAGAIGGGVAGIVLVTLLVALYVRVQRRRNSGGGVAGAGVRKSNGVATVAPLNHVLGGSSSGSGGRSGAGATTLNPMFFPDHEDDRYDQVDEDGLPLASYEEPVAQQQGSGNNRADAGAAGRDYVTPAPVGGIDYDNVSGTVQAQYYSKATSPGEGEVRYYSVPDALRQPQGTRAQADSNGYHVPVQTVVLDKPAEGAAWKTKGGADEHTYALARGEARPGMQGVPTTSDYHVPFVASTGLSSSGGAKHDRAYQQPEAQGKTTGADGAGTYEYAFGFDLTDASDDAARKRAVPKLNMKLDDGGYSVFSEVDTDSPSTAPARKDDAHVYGAGFLEYEQPREADPFAGATGDNEGSADYAIARAPDRVALNATYASSIDARGSAADHVEYGFGGTSAVDGGGRGDAVVYDAASSASRGGHKSSSGGDDGDGDGDGKGAGRSKISLRGWSLRRSARAKESNTDATVTGGGVDFVGQQGLVHKNASRRKAEALLLPHAGEQGAFLVRTSRKKAVDRDGEPVLHTWAMSLVAQKGFQHHLLYVTQAGTFKVNGWSLPGSVCTLSQAVAHLQRTPVGMSTRLTRMIPAKT